MRCNSWMGWVAGAMLTLPVQAAAPLEVLIAPDAYRVGQQVSRLATPAVDAVVQAQPQHVRMVMCPAAPPAKTIQFQVELQARWKGKVDSELHERACGV